MGNVIVFALFKVFANTALLNVSTPISKSV